MIIFGKNAVYEAIRSEKTFNKLLVDKSARDKQMQKVIDLARENNVKINFVDKKVIDAKADSISKNKNEKINHQGVLGEIIEFEYSSVDDILNDAEEKNMPPFIVILDGVEDPHNLGAIIRTAECANVNGIIVPEHRACAVNETVIKTSAGAVNNIKIARVTNLNREIEYLQKRGVWVYACELGGDNLFKKDLTGPIAIVLGSEGQGVSKLTLKKCDGTFTIPMFGKINSLNVSVATAGSIYEIVKQRN